MKALLARISERLVKLMDHTPESPEEQEIIDNAALTLVSIYRLAEKNNWLQIMVGIERTGIDLNP